MTRQQEKRTTSSVLVPVLVIVGLALVAGVFLWSSRRSGDSPAGRSSGRQVAVEHVHGLGINPRDGSLIVATHLGSFRMAADGGAAERIGESHQDTMGFTVAGPDHFLGSGHPDVAGMRAGQPARLGLIESTDAGATWRTLSLGGEADFHALAHVRDAVYGWDSATGGFMVTHDKRTWETRSRVDLRGFAVDPADADHVVGIGRSGLLDSTDGGRTWRATDGPPLLVVGWERTAGLWGLDASGTAWQRADAGWIRRGAVGGVAQALLVTADRLYAAAHDASDRTVIYSSDDGGESWAVRYQEPAD